jgi:GH43 family beta-xylosidase
MRIPRSTALVLAACLGGGAALSVAPASAAVPQAALQYDFSDLPAVGSAVSAGDTIVDGAAAHAGTVRGAGAQVVTGPRGGGDLALALPGGDAASGAAFVEIAPGLTSASTGDVTVSAWLKWNGGQECSWAYGLGASTGSYLFATPQCGGRLIGAVKQDGEQRATDDGPAASGRWTHVAVVLDAGVSVSTWVDGQMVASTPTNATGAATVGTSTFSGLIGKSFYSPDPYFAGAVDDVRVDLAALSGEQIGEIAAPVAAIVSSDDAAAIDIGDTDAVTGDLVLPTVGAGGSTISWTSSDPDVVGADGTVRRPAPGSQDASATLTATTTFAGATAEVTFAVTVKADSDVEAAARLRDALVVPPVVSSGTVLSTAPGVALDWSVDAAPLTGGTLDNPTDAAQAVTVTATARVGSEDVTKSFAVTVLPAATGQQLVSYTRQPTNDLDANQESIARSIHLAVGTSVDTAAALFQNYGIVFAEGEYVGVDNVDQRGVASPSPFYFADGRLGFLSTRVFMSGAPDATAATSTLVFRATDETATAYDELGALDLGTTAGVVNPRAVWDSAAQQYLVSWTTGTGIAQHTTVEDLARTELVPAPFSPESNGQRSRVVADGNRGAVVNGTLLTVAEPDLAGFASATANAIPGGSVPIAGELADTLSVRFSRVVNTDVTVAPQTREAGEAADLGDTRADLDYSDGSTGSLPVDWNADELAAAQSAKEGVFDVTGTVRQADYSEPFAYNRADPTVFRWDDDGTVKYLFIATDDTNNNNIASVHLPIRVGSTIEELADANGGASREVDLLNRDTRRDTTSDGRVIAGCYWAPEIHEVGGRLSILFAPCFNSQDPQSSSGADWTTVEAHIMQLRDGGDPAVPGDWSKPQPVLAADGSPLGRAGYDGGISLDMTYFEADGKAYYAWSQRYVDQSGLGDPGTWIAEVDPTDPSRIIGEAKQIIAPSLSYELRLSEGAFAVEHDGRINLIYSSDGVSPRYVVGGVWAEVGSDLTDIDNWHKYGTPLLKSTAMPTGVVDYLTYQQGPGHGAITTDDDGNLLYVYHTWGDGVGGAGRDTRIARIHWAADGRPVLDMTAAEQLLPSLRTVAMRVTIEAADGEPGIEPGTVQPGTGQPGTGQGGTGQAGGTSNAPRDAFAVTGSQFPFGLAVFGILLTVGGLSVISARRARARAALASDATTKAQTVEH